jgi:2-oxoglutarate dehydrogenase E2 component (dihydrolipoamide succinyltransferase)
MIIEITIPSPGESIKEVTLAKWLAENGDFVDKDQEIAEIESDKATLPLIAKESGKLLILIQAGNNANVGDIACTIDTDQKAEVQKKDDVQKKEDKIPEKENHAKTEKSNSQELKTKELKQETSLDHLKISPVAQKLMEENNLSIEELINGLKRIGKKEVEMVLNSNDDLSTRQFKTKEITRNTEREKLSPLRKKLSERLVAVKNQTAMLTTFNEVDMSKVLSIRKKYQDIFIEKYGVKLGLMSFFTKAASIALKLYPNVNSMIDGDELVHYSYSDIGIAVQTDKGLMVPVLRNVEALGLADIEKQLIDLATRARKFRISIDEMSGGTFSITNGGVFGSMLSTPLINPPQAGILGMHNIVERPVAIDGIVEIRPIMYVALSYDHRVIDGRDSVGFLKTIKDLIENPGKMLVEGKGIEEVLLGV